MGMREKILDSDILGRVKNSVFVKKCVKTGGALLITGVTLASAAGIASSVEDLHDINKNRAELSARQESVLTDVKTDEDFIDWYKNKVAVSKNALAEGVITEEDFAEQVDKFTTNDYLKENIQNLDFVDKGVKEEQAEIDTKTAQLNKKENEIAPEHGLCAVGVAVSLPFTVDAYVTESKKKKRIREAEKQARRAKMLEELYSSEENEQEMGM